jgi:hypothetical protein
MASPSAHANIPFWGIDLPPENRPGVPYERAPRPLAGAHWITPARQVPTVPVLKRAGLAQLTPVFGTAAPPHGLSGRLRKVGYDITDDKVRHWMVLLLADRVDVIESNLGDVAKRVLPIAAIALAVGAGIRALRR